MAWKTKKEFNSKTKYFSLANKLRKEKKINREFESQISNLTLEELIGLKLELSTKAVDNRLYNLPIWHSLVNIVQEAVLSYAFSATRTKREAMRFIGLNERMIYKLKDKYDINAILEEIENDEQL
tara:strand:+ start:1940 stop:2314 length:375 start_codon:yes stop_codon:yes gene_type:complete